ncbi:MAG: hypothetical protein M3N93_09215, partial [Acidobacteriota bacterium]|nr:hypothetical protein [Acidobacteriota bacterium]
MCLRDTELRFRTGSASTAKPRACTFGKVFLLIVGLTAPGPAQVPATPQLTVNQSSMEWKRIAGTTLNLGLAGPASGPVASVWYAPGTGTLLAETASSRIFETADFVHWRLNTIAIRPATTGAGSNSVSVPEAGAKVQIAGSRLYASAPSNVFASDDSGRTWLNLTAFNNQSIIGNGFKALAVATRNSQEIAAGNESGVWRSLDGGLSWTSLNEDLPNLLVRKLIDRRTIVLADGTIAAATLGTWTPAAGADPEIALRSRLGAALHAPVTAAVSSGTTVYAGTAQGRLFSSHDSGATWNEAPESAGGNIARLWMDSDRPNTALAAAGVHLYRTVNGGQFWDEVTGTLQSGVIHGIAADRSAGTVYVATDNGVSAGRLSLNDAGGAGTDWRTISRDLPAAPAWDVRLNPDGTLTVALDGYGVFEASAPYQNRNLRLVSGADLTERPAAPGSLISVLGAKVTSARNQGMNYPVLAASEQSSQLQVPFEASPGTFSLTVVGVADQRSVPLIVKDAAPAIFVDQEGSPLILDAASGLVVEPKIAVYAGSTVEILATGLGRVNPEWPTGVPGPVDSPPAVVGTVNAFIDGRQIEVTRAVLAPNYVGYYLVELQIPAIVNRGASELRLSMNGNESNLVKLYLE